MAKVAKRFYGEPALHRKLALYNGIQDPNHILMGHGLEIPSRRELEGGGVAAPRAVTVPVPAAAQPARPATAVVPAMVPPNGLEEILATFGNINEFIRDDGTLEPKWETEFLDRVSLPFPIRFPGTPRSSPRGSTATVSCVMSFRVCSRRSKDRDWNRKSKPMEVASISAVRERAESFLPIVGASP